MQEREQEKKRGAGEKERERETTDLVKLHKLFIILTPFYVKMLVFPLSSCVT